MVLASAAGVIAFASVAVLLAGALLQAATERAARAAVAIRTLRRVMEVIEVSPFEIWPAYFASEFRHTPKCEAPLSFCHEEMITAPDVGAFRRRCFCHPAKRRRARAEPSELFGARFPSTAWTSSASEPTPFSEFAAANTFNSFESMMNRPSKINTKLQI